MSKLLAYFDRSESGPSGSIATVGGVIGTLDQWSAVECEWRQSLSEWSLDEFHLCEIEHKLGQEKGNLCKKNFSRILDRNELLAICASCDASYLAEFDDQKNAPYIHCLGQCFKLSAQTARLEFNGILVEVVVDRDIKPKNKIIDVFEEHKKINVELNSISIGSTSVHIGLQCADLIAGANRRQYEVGGLLASRVRNQHAAGLRIRSLGSVLSASTAKIISETLEILEQEKP